MAMAEPKKSKQKASFDDLMDISSTLSFFMKNEKNINKRIDNGASESDFLKAYEFFCELNQIPKVRSVVFRAVFRAYCFSEGKKLKDDLDLEDELIKYAMGRFKEFKNKQAQNKKTREKIKAKNNEEIPPGFVPPPQQKQGFFQKIFNAKNEEQNKDDESNKALRTDILQKLNLKQQEFLRKILETNSAKKHDLLSGLNAASPEQHGKLPTWLNELSEFVDSNRLSIEIMPQAIGCALRKSKVFFKDYDSFPPSIQKEIKRYEPS